MSRSTQLTGARKMIDAAEWMVGMAARILPRDGAFDELRTGLIVLRRELSGRSRELITYASFAATIESTQNTIQPTEAR